MANPHVHGQASRLAQLLGEVIVHHAPWSAEVTEQTRRRVTDEWLDRLEEHSAGLVAPLIGRILQDTDVPAEIRPLLENAVSPTAALGSVVQNFLVFGIGTAVGSQIVQPFIEILGEDIWTAAVDGGLSLPVPPASLTTMAVRNLPYPPRSSGHVTPGLLEQAKKSGYGATQMEALYSAAGNPPSPQDLFEMFRRGIIDENGVKQGLREGDTRDDWVDNFVKLGHVWPSPVDFVRAAVQAQLTYTGAESWAGKAGLDTSTDVGDGQNMFDLLHNIAGRPPGPEEMGHMANRGIIGWTGTGHETTTFQQGIAESDIKTKWTPALQEFQRYFPPPGEVRQLLMHGGITAEQAKTLWMQAGITSEIADALLHLAQIEQITQDKALAKGDIEQLVQQRAIDDNTALELLQQVGYSGQNAAYIVEMSHFRYELAILRRSVQSIGSYYTSHRITAAQAREAFSSLGLPASQLDQLMATLTTERNAVVQIPTAPQVASGFYYGVIGQQVAQTMLEQLGFGPWDAWFALSVRNHGPLPDEPPRPATIQNG